MFSKAIAMAMPYTRPVIRMIRFFNGQVEFKVGTLIVVNQEGWFISAAHIWKGHELFAKHQPEIVQYQEKMKNIAKNISDRKKAENAEKLLKRSANPHWVVNDGIMCIFYLEHEAPRLHSVSINFFSDIVVGRIEGFKPAFVTNYPVFSNTNDLQPGTSLCKLGFPFPIMNETQVTVDGNVDKVDFGKLQLPYFPLDGMFTRNKTMINDKNEKAEFIETSTPGIPGQSGGPVFDVNGIVWALQSHTNIFDLNMVAPKMIDGKEMKTPQYLSVGQGTNVSEIRKELDKLSIKYDMKK